MSCWCLDNCIVFCDWVSFSWPRRLLICSSSSYSCDLRLRQMMLSDSLLAVPVPENSFQKVCLSYFWSHHVLLYAPTAFFPTEQTPLDALTPESPSLIELPSNDLRCDRFVSGIHSSCDRFVPDVHPLALIVQRQRNGVLGRFLKSPCKLSIFFLYSLASFLSPSHWDFNWLQREPMYVNNNPPGRCLKFYTCPFLPLCLCVLSSN